MSVEPFISELFIFVGGHVGVIFMQMLNFRKTCFKIGLSLSHFLPHLVYIYILLMISFILIHLVSTYYACLVTSVTVLLIMVTMFLIVLTITACSCKNDNFCNPCIFSSFWALHEVFFQKLPGIQKDQAASLWRFHLLHMVGVNPEVLNVWKLSGLSFLCGISKFCTIESLSR